MSYSFSAPIRSSIDSSTMTKSSDKSRLYRYFKSTIQLDELSLPTSSTDESQRFENLSGVQYPIIKINDYIIALNEIDDFSIDSTKLLPSITLRCTFTHQIFMSKEMPKDGDIISVAIVNKSDMLNILRNDYVITNVMSSSTDPSGKGQYTLSFFGILFVPGLSSAKLNLSYEGTSFDAMKDCASALGLGFVTNENNTDDRQVWLSGRNKLYEYIDKTIKRSWKDEKSFFNVWIDVYYNLNFVNVNKQLMSSESSVDSAVWLNAIDHEYTFGNKINKASETEIPKVFSNYMNYRTSSFYITSWRALNKSTAITFDIGTRSNGQMFEHNNKLYAEENSKKYWSLDMSPIYDESKVKNHIIFRGRSNRDNTDDTMFKQANYSYVDLYESRPWMGIQYTITNPSDDNLQWDGNHHKNYLRAGVQNIINNKELDKLTVSIDVNGTNANVIRGDKIPVALIKTDRLENMLVDKRTAGHDIIDLFYSGWYYVKGFSISWNRDKSKSLSSNFTQTFILSRREWPTPIPVDPITT